MKRIGIDVGGTNTDAVLLDGSAILRSIKTPTTADVTSGVKAALAHVLESTDGVAPDVRAVMIGTTHFTNAVVERRGLSKVAVIRIGLPAASSIEPMANWPEDLRAAVAGPVFLLEGGMSSTAVRSPPSTVTGCGGRRRRSATAASARWRSRRCSRR